MKITKEEVEILYRIHHKRILAIALDWLKKGNIHDPEDKANDVMQEVYLALLLKCIQNNDYDNFGTRIEKEKFLFGILKRKIIDVFRYHSRLVSFEGFGEESSIDLQHSPSYYFYRIRKIYPLLQEYFIRKIGEEEKGLKHFFIIKSIFKYYYFSDKEIVTFIDDEYHKRFKENLTIENYRTLKSRIRSLNRKDKELKKLINELIGW